MVSTFAEESEAPGSGGGGGGRYRRSNLLSDLLLLHICAVALHAKAFEVHVGPLAEDLQVCCFRL